MAGKLGVYQLQDLLGEGGMGQVFRAVAPDGRTVAVKTIRANLGEREDLRLRFDREVRIAQKVVHENVVLCLDAGEEGGRRYMVLEFVDGGDLAGLVKRGGPLDERRALELLRPVAAALDHAHRLGLVHRDLKPQNVLLTRDGTPKVSDLGLAIRTTADATRFTNEGEIVGSPHFMAPEQAQGITELDARTDYYALGLLVYYMLVGKPPYSGSVAQILRQHVEKPPPDLAAARPGTDARIVTLVSRLAQKNREARPASGAEVLGLFDEALASVGGAASAVTEVPVWSGSAGARPATPPATGAPERRTVSGRQTIVSDAPASDGAADARGESKSARIALDVAPGDAQRLRIVVFAARELVLGRDSAVDVTLRPLPESAHEAAILSVSGKHARLTLDSARATIEDLGSRNGTKLDGRALRPREPAALADGSRLELGGMLELRVRLLARAGTLDGVLLLRTRNTPNHAYLVLAGTAPLTGILHLVTGAPWGFADLPLLQVDGGALTIKPGERGASGPVRWEARAVTPEVFKQPDVPEVAR
jgi:hypothetical protein